MIENDKDVKELEEAEQEIKILDKSFFSQDFKYRTKEVTLINFGEKNETVKIVVRQLTSRELFEIQARLDRDQERIAKAMLAALNMEDKDIEKAVEVMQKGYQDKPREYIRKLHYLYYGIQEPKFNSIPEITKFCEYFPIDSNNLMNVISQLTNMGAIVATMNPQESKKKQKKTTKGSK